MSNWLLIAAGGAVGVALWYLSAIFKEVRSIRRMMNTDRGIQNELND